MHLRYTSTVPVIFVVHKHHDDDHYTCMLNSYIYSDIFTYLCNAYEYLLVKAAIMTTITTGIAITAAWVVAFDGGLVAVDRNTEFNRLIKYH